MTRWPGVVQFLWVEVIIPKILLKRLLRLLVGTSLCLLLGSTAGVAYADPISLWQIDNKQARVYLLGSVHTLRPETYPLADEIDAAFEESDKTVFEVDLSLDVHVN